MSYRVGLAGAFVFAASITTTARAGENHDVFVAAFQYLPGQADTLAGSAGPALPDTLVVHQGDRVTLTNLDPVMDHTITSGTNGVPDGKFDSNFVHFAESRSVVLVDGLPPGRYPFYCTEHTFMHGILVVQ